MDVNSSDSKQSLANEQNQTQFSEPDSEKAKLAFERERIQMEREFRRLELDQERELKQLELERQEELENKRLKIEWLKAGSIVIPIFLVAITVREFNL